MTSKEQARVELQAQIDDYLARGGTITKCPTRLAGGSDVRGFAQSKEAVKESRS